MKPKLTICMPFYRNGSMLRVQQDAWARWPDDLRERLTVVIVDDGSPDNTALDNVQPCDYDLQIYRILVNKPWNQNGARNLAMHVAPDGWCLVTDFDHVLERDQAASAFQWRRHGGEYYIPARRLAESHEPYKRHPNSYILTKELFWRTGGCDEDFCGTYGSDSTFRRAIAAAGRRVEVARPVLTLYGRQVVADASTTDWGRKQSPYHSVNFPELRAKKKETYRAVNPLRFPWERVR